jgi:crossover junction endodeoxyribonuclease RusA
MIVDRFELTVPGEPVPNARARAGAHGHYTPRRTVEYRERVQATWMVAGRPSLGDAPFVLSASFYRSSRRECDLDNLVKGVLDALNGLAWADDRQLVCLSGVHKFTVAAVEARTELGVWVSAARAAA